MDYIINCPECGAENKIEGDDFPELSCDSAEHECVCCEYVFEFGWYAEIEVR